MEPCQISCKISKMDAIPKSDSVRICILGYMNIDILNDSNEKINLLECFCLLSIFWLIDLPCGQVLFTHRPKNFLITEKRNV